MKKFLFIIPLITFYIKKSDTQAQETEIKNILELLYETLWIINDEFSKNLVNNLDKIE
jgi:hypothetical protein